MQDMYIINPLEDLLRCHNLDPAKLYEGVERKPIEA